MIERLRGWWRERRRRPFEERRLQALSQLVRELLPGRPYLFAVAPSFLQPALLDLADPTRLDLFFPEIPLAIDGLGPESSPRYAEAAPYCSRTDWERYQARQADKERLLRRYGCPYLRIGWDEPHDLSSLSNRIRELLGSLPR